MGEGDERERKAPFLLFGLGQHGPIILILIFFNLFLSKGKIPLYVPFLKTRLHKGCSYKIDFAAITQIL